MILNAIAYYVLPTCYLRATYVLLLVLLLLLPLLLLSVDVPVAANIKRWKCARDRLPRFYKAAPLQLFEQTLKPSLLSSAVSLWRFLRDNRRNRRGNGVSGCAVKETKRVLGLREAHCVLAYWAVERVPVATCCNYLYIYMLYDRDRDRYR